MTLTTFETPSRRVDVWVEDDGYTGPRPVLVMHDGQNLFSEDIAPWGVTWQVPAALKSVADLGPSPVVIGAFNTGITRAAEYAPEQVIRSLPDEPYQFVGEQVLTPLTGDAYQAELVDIIIPKVAEMFPLDMTRVAIGGSSMGGLASLYGMALYPQIYGAALCFSTHWSMSTVRFATTLIDMLPEPSRGNRLWLDHGTESIDVDYGHTQAEVDLRLAAHGYRWPQVESRRYIGTTHNEVDWAERLPIVLRWWLEGISR